jgi:ubiquinone biosynthesis accessory factor UbiK
MRGIIMLDPKFFDKLAKQLSELIPPQFQSMREELQANFKTTLQGIFSKLNLVTREEFDVQTRLLEKARERISLLEKRIAELEQTKS